MGVKISALPEADATDGTELVEIVQAGTNVQCSVSDLMNGFFYSEGDFEATLIGVLESVIDTIQWIKMGSIVSLTIPAMSGTSNSIGLSLSALPVELRPTTNAIYMAAPNGSSFYNNGSVFDGAVSAYIGSETGNLYFDKGSSWTIGAAKGIAYPIILQYLLF